MLQLKMFKMFADHVPDPYKVGAIALFNVCNPDTAMLFDTGKGHTIPRAGLVLQEWREAFEETIAIAERN